MKRLIRIVAAAVFAGSLFAGGAALAQGHGYGHDRGQGWGRGGEEWRGGPPGRGQDGWSGGPPGRGQDGWRGGRGPPRWDYGPPPRTYAAPYPGMPVYPRRLPPPGYGVRRGGLLPPQYRGAVVPDYGRHRLRPPPPGFAWVRMGHGYALVSRATGQIFDVIGD